MQIPRYPSVCKLCHHRIRPGDWIIELPSLGWVHRGCDDSRPDYGNREL